MGGRGITRATLGATALYRRTFDRGTTWSGTRSITTVLTGQFSMDPQFTYRGGVLGVVFKFRRPGASPIFYRYTRDVGTSWYPATRYSFQHGTPGGESPGGVVLLDGRILGGYFQTNWDSVIGYWIRRGAP